MEEKNLIQKIKEKADERYAICKECPEFFDVLKQCKKCGCYMPGKVLVPYLHCPIGKW